MLFCAYRGRDFLIVWFSAVHLKVVAPIMFLHEQWGFNTSESEAQTMAAKRKIIGAGKYLQLVNDNGWEYAERKGPSGIVAIIAVTRAGNVLLTEQYRPPIGKNVIELPAGLAGDTSEFQGESLEIAARRELLEETGYEARGMKELVGGPISAGFGTEILTFFRATGLKRMNDGGGDESEDIVVHEIPLAKTERWLLSREDNTTTIDPKVFVGLYFARKYSRS